MKSKNFMFINTNPSKPLKNRIFKIEEKNRVDIASICDRQKVIYNDIIFEASKSPHFVKYEDYFYDLLASNRDVLVKGKKNLRKQFNEGKKKNQNIFTHCPIKNCEFVCVPENIYRHVFAYHSIPINFLDNCPFCFNFVVFSNNFAYLNSLAARDHLNTCLELAKSIKMDESQKFCCNLDYQIDTYVESLYKNDIQNKKKNGSRRVLADRLKYKQELDEDKIPLFLPNKYCSDICNKFRLLNPPEKEHYEEKHEMTIVCSEIEPENVNDDAIETVDSGNAPLPQSFLSALSLLPANVPTYESGNYFFFNLFVLKTTRSIDIREKNNFKCN